MLENNISDLTITVILPGSCWSNLLLRVVTQDAMSRFFTWTLK